MHSFPLRSLIAAAACLASIQFAGVGQAADTRNLAVRSVGASRLALVIGNDSYKSVPELRNARADARSMAQALTQAGFSVALVLDADEKAMKAALRTFKARIAGGDDAVFFYSGHGIQLGAANYLLPIDIRSESEEQIKDDGVLLQRVLDDLQEQKARFSLAIVDACRNNPFKSKGRAIGGRGLAPTTAATGQMVLYSAGSGQEALDRLGDADTSPNGLFTRVFLQQMQKPGVPVDRVLRNVRDEVVRAAKSVGHEQVPALYDQALGEFFFYPPAADAQVAAAAQASPAAAATDPMAVELAFWDAIKSSTNRADLEEYLRQYPGGRFAGLARNRLSAAALATQVASAAPSAAAIPQAAPVRSLAAVSPGTAFRDCADCPEMVLIPAGSFTMGSPASEQGRKNDEGPQHNVTISRPFAAGKFEVSFDEWDACVRASGCSYNPRDQGWGRGKRPVINVSWQDARQYMEWLSKKTGRNYRLLSEAEWEYATRAGTTTAFSTGATLEQAQANFDASQAYAGSVTGAYRNRNQTVAVGGYGENAFGLYDVHGNVWEWTEDCYNTSYNGAPADGSAWRSGGCGRRVLRGGSWSDYAVSARSALRSNANSDYRNHEVGFRLAVSE